MDDYKVVLQAIYDKAKARQDLNTLIKSLQQSAEIEFGIKINKGDVTSILNTSKQLSDLDRTKFSNRMQSWLKSNSAAARVFGKEIEKLIAECQTCDNVRFNQLKKEFTSLTYQAQLAGKTGKNFTDTMTAGIRKFSEWGLASRAVMGVIQAIKQMINTVVELDTKMTELAKVSDATNRQLQASFEKSVKTAKELGATVTDVISATADWSRLGYNLPDSEELAKIAVLYKNVGDGIDIDTANESLISTLQGFQLEADKALSIVDKFNEVDTLASICRNTYALFYV